MPEVLQVTATTLNLRRSPAISPSNIIGRLGHGELVEKIAQSAAGWLEVKSAQLSGFAAAQFLVPSTKSLPTTSPSATTGFVPPRVNFDPDPRAALDSTAQRYCPLNGIQPRARPSGQSDAARCTELSSIVQLLDVEHSERYQPTATTTFCNIYAYDLCYLAGLYLPRVWWTTRALLELSRGTSPESIGTVYAKTVQELTANATFDWLTEWGSSFGWRRCADVAELQDCADHGSLGVICAQRRDLSRSGHIVAVVPETAQHQARRSGQTVTVPLQSQAGARNRQYFCSSWWIDLGPEFRAYDFWSSS